MKKVVFGIIAGLIVGAAATWLFLQKQHAGGGEPEKKEEKKEESRVLHGTNGETYLKLDKETQERMGLKVAALESFALKPEVKGYGRVLDPAPLAALIVEDASAHAAMEASLKEFQRVKLLHAQDQNVSTRALETAEAAVKRDQILVEAIQLKLVAAWGRPIASQPNLPGFVHALATLEIALVRIDLPLGQALASPPLTCRLAVPGAEERTVEAELLGPVTSADPQTQGQGFLFLVHTDLFLPGAAVVAWLGVAGEPAKGVTVPRAALLRHEGEVFVYVQTGDETFQRKEIELVRPVDKGWFVSEGLKPQEKVVVVGAQMLLSEEVKGPGGE